MRFVNVVIVANIQLGIVHWNWILATTVTFPKANCDAFNNCTWVFASQEQCDIIGKNCDLKRKNDVSRV